MSSETAEKNLKKRIGFLGLLAMSVGLNIGGALFALTTLAAEMTGPSLPMAMLIASIPCLLAAAPYCMFTSSLPTTAATYRYIQLLNPTLSLVSMLTLLTCILIGAQPLFALAFGKYLEQIIPVDPIIAGLLVLTFFYVINLFGVEITAKLQIVLLFFLISALLLFIVMGAPEIQLRHFSNPFPKGLGGVLIASGLLFTFSSGGFFVIDLGGEVIQAPRTYPKVLLLGILIVATINILVMFVVVGVSDVSSLKGKSLVHVSELFLSKPAVAYFTIAGALIACATTINVVFSTVARGLMAVSADGLLPKALGRISKRSGVPRVGLTISYLINVIALTTIPSLLFFGSMLNLGLIFAITMVVVSGLVFPKKYPKLYGRSLVKFSPLKHKIVCVSVIALNSLIFIFFVFAIGKAALVFFGVAVCASLYALSRKKTLNSFDISNIFPDLTLKSPEWQDTKNEQQGL